MRVGAVFSCVVLSRLVLWFLVLSCIVLYCVVFSRVLLCCLMLCCVVLSVLPYLALLCCVVLPCLVLYYIVLYCVMLSCLVLCCVVLSSCVLWSWILSTYASSSFSLPLDTLFPLSRLVSSWCFISNVGIVFSSRSDTGYPLDIWTRWRAWGFLFSCSCWQWTTRRAQCRQSFAFKTTAPARRLWPATRTKLTL
jgi:hypothetical protein